MALIHFRFGSGVCSVHLRATLKCAPALRKCGNCYERDIIPEGNLFNPILSKRKSFSHEQEIRAVAWERLSAEISGGEIKKNMDAGGFPISIDLNLLIERVYVSPTAAPWFEDVIRHLVNSHDIAAPVVKSSLASRPLY